ncbi:MAG: alpha-amylase/4-alpha-glucanotransferase domain-containing protein, partial [Desulfurella sp.]
IHSEIFAKESGIENFIFYDKNNRYTLVDHFVDKELTLKEIFESSFNQINGILKYNTTALDYSIHLENKQFGIRKVYTINNASFMVDIYKTQDQHILYQELNFTFLSAFFDKQIIINEKEYSMDSFIEEESDNILFVDNYRKIYFNLNFTPSKVLLVPVYSVSLSESGIEKLYQQTCLFIKCDVPMFSIKFDLL